MTNAEKLAKDTNFMADSIIQVCINTNCRQCRFSAVDGERVFCPIYTDRGDTFRDDVKEWLESDIDETIDMT